MIFISQKYKIKPYQENNFTENKQAVNRIYLLLFIILINLVSVTISWSQTVTVKLEVDGLGAEKEKALLNSLTLSRQAQENNLNDDYIRVLYKRAEKEIIQNLQVFGYFKSKVNAVLDDNETPWIAKYVVTLGEPMRVNTVNLQITGEGQQDLELQQWQKDFPIKTGEILDQQVYEQAKQDLQVILRERGYFHAKFQTSEMKVSLQEYTSQININLDTGPRFLFGAVTFNQKEFDEKFLAKFVPFKAGQLFESDKIVQLQKDLTFSNEFQQIEISPQIDQAVEKMVPIEITLTARKPWQYLLGAGYGTDTGPRAIAKIERHQITDTGQNANANLYYSQIKKNLSFQYNVPLANPVSDKLVFSAARNVEDTDISYSESNSVTTSEVHKYKVLERTISISYLNETYEISNVRDQSNLVIPSIALAYAPEALTKDNDNREKDRLRWHLNASLKGADQNYGSDVTFLQGRLYIGNQFDVFRDLTLVSRIDVGWTWADEFTVLPVSQRFFAGGDWSVRGFSYNSLGPEDDSGEVVGGRRLLVGSVEAQYKFAPKWDAAVFYDAGNAFDDTDFIPEQSTGFGIGWQMSIVTIRGYAAYGLTNDGYPWRIHVLFSAAW